MTPAAPALPAAFGRRGAPLLAALSTAALAGLVSTVSVGCNPARKTECDRFLAAMKPLADGVPTADAVDRVQASVAALKLQDQPLAVYAKNYSATLTVLAKTLELKASGSAPDGTDDVIKRKLKEARTDAADTARYCAQ